jgi:hypothetical protein
LPTVSPPLPPLPPPRAVDAVLSDTVVALGGAAAIARHRSMHTRMDITFTGLGISGTAEHYAAAGDKVLSVMSIPNLASTREGGDGSRFWSDDPINGLRILEGAEVEQARVEAAWNAELRTKELFPKVEVKNERSDEGQLLECLVLTPKTGAAMTDCYDAGTHLLSVQRGVRSGPQGDMPFVAKLKDWRMVGDMKVAYTTEMQVGPLAFVGRLTAVELDVPIDRALFAVPSAPASQSGAAGGVTGKSKSKSAVKKSRAAKAPTTTAPSPAR